MKRIRSFFLILLSFFVLFGSLGMLIFKHSCNQKGVSISFFIHSDSQNKNDIPCKSSSRCCSNDSSKNNCCHDDISYLKINIDFVSIKKGFFANVKFFKKELVFNDFYNQHLDKTSFVNFCKIYPPPIISDNEILIRNQTFRI